MMRILLLCLSITFSIMVSASDHVVKGQKGEVSLNDKIEKTPEVIGTAKVEQVYGKQITLSNGATVKPPLFQWVTSKTFTYDSSKFKSFKQFKRRPGDPAVTHMDLKENVDDLTPMFSDRRPLDSSTRLQFADWILKPQHAGKFPIQSEGNLVPKPRVGEEGNSEKFSWAGKIDSLCVDIDVDSNNDGVIDTDDDGEDLYEELEPGALLTFNKAGNTMGPAVSRVNDIITAKLKVRPPSGDSGIVKLTWTNSSMVRVSKYSDFWTLLHSGAMFSQDSLPKEIYIDAIYEPQYSVIPITFTLEYESRATGIPSQIQGKDVATITIVPTLCMTPSAKKAVSYSSTYMWSFTSASDLVRQLQTFSPDYSFAQFIDRKGFDDNYGGCTADNLARLAKDSSFVHIEGHGSGNSIYVATAPNFDKAINWVSASLHIDDFDFEKMEEGYVIVARSSFFEREWKARNTKNQSIVYLDCCSAASGPLINSVGGRVALGYGTTVRASQTYHDVSQLIRLMTSSPYTRSVVRAVNEIDGNQAANDSSWAKLEYVGNPFTTLSPSPTFGDSCYPKINPGKDQWGAIVLDSFVLSSDLSRAIVKLGGSSSISGIRGANNRHIAPWVVGFNCSKGDGKVRAIAKYITAYSGNPTLSATHLDGNPSDGKCNTNKTWSW